MTPSLHQLGAPGPKGPAGPAGPAGQNVSKNKKPSFLVTYRTRQLCKVLQKIVCLSCVKKLSASSQGKPGAAGTLGPVGPKGERGERVSCFFSHLLAPYNKKLRDLAFFVCVIFFFQGPSGYPGERGIRGEPVSPLSLRGGRAITLLFTAHDSGPSYSSHFLTGSPRSKGRAWREGFAGKEVPSNDAHILHML